MDIRSGQGLIYTGNRLDVVGTAGRITVGTSVDLATVSGVSGSYKNADITVDGYGRITTVSNGHPHAWVVAATAYPAVAGDRILVDTTSAPVTVTLPATPVMGDTIEFCDAAGMFNTNVLTVARNGSNIMGAPADMTVNTQNMSFSLVYYNVLNGWRIVQ
jgi:hypothetical protein